MRRSVVAFVAACVVAAVFAACGGHSPTTPTPSGGGNGGGNQQPPPNNAPVIDSIAVQGTRAKEPANFADVGEPIAITAKVHDDETPVDQLQFQWKATIGTFDGTGASVTWTPPADAPTPSDVTITLTVVEKFGNPGQPAIFQNTVNGTAAVSLHNSVKEVGDMARQFLLDFSDSSIRDVDYILRNFTPRCRGTQGERDDVTNNRAQFKIVNYTVGDPVTTVNFGGLCPFRAIAGDACAQVPVFWDSIVLADNSRGAVAGTDQVAAVYLTDTNKWALCDSEFNGHKALNMQRFIR